MFEETGKLFDGARRAGFLKYILIIDMYGIIND